LLAGKLITMLRVERHRWRGPLSSDPMTSLAGLRVIVTRERLGELGPMLEERGATVIHSPLISIDDSDDIAMLLRKQLVELDSFDWLVVTSVAGAERVGAAAVNAPKVRLAAVGAVTAQTLSALAHRSVDLVPTAQTASALADELIALTGNHRNRILVAQADVAADSLVESLRAAGQDVTSCVAYRTTSRPPDGDATQGAAAVLFASGSAARSWVQALGTVAPDIVVVIGPSTAQVAKELGLKVTGVAADHTLEGLVTELERQVFAFPTDVRET
jgi:uroporphyrinogen-III synthase